MNSRDIEYVLTLAKLQSFSKAAQKLYVTQPSLSQYIMNIEKQLGAVLFDRSTSPIRLTRAGEAYVAAAERIKALEDGLVNELSDMANLNCGTLKLGASTFRTSCLLSRSIAEFCRRYEGISVSITEDNTEQLKFMLKNSELDAVIGTGDFDDRLFHREELASERLYIAVPPENPINEQLADYRLTGDDLREGSMKLLSAKTPELSVFVNERLICVEHGEFGEDAVCRIFEESGLRARAALRVRTVETVFSFVSAGLGIAFIPDTLIRFGNFRNHPYYYRTKSSLSEQKISLYSRKNGYFSRAAAEYCLVLKQLIDIGTWKL